MAATTSKALTRAEARMASKRAAGPRAVAARYERRRRQIVVTLESGLELAFAPELVEGLEEAAPRALGLIEVSPSQLGLYFPLLDADIHLPSLLAGHTGSRAWMAAAMGKLGGQSRTAAKSAASRANGRLGGRPRKGTSR